MFDTTSDVNRVTQALPLDESAHVFEDLVVSDLDTIYECVQPSLEACDDQTHTQVILSPLPADLNDGTLKEVSGIYICNVFAGMPDRETNMEVADSVKNDLVKPEPQVFDKMFHTISTVKCDSSNLFKFDEILLTIPCMLSTCIPARGIFVYLSEIDHAKLPLSSYRLPPDQFGLDFPFDPGLALQDIIHLWLWMISRRSFRYQLVILIPH
ncbi:hypothetical protein K7X08_031333 [Anisodus acutangulus]|uniref:Uncharacterized protein n=1 Tax=Anisodus acutangulus TaxID=402998 RepID=A0A9Q1RMM5_9SOLA|nr:hypothetical protein K7X08_031333 [Anisodus acutangulus]